MRVAVLAPMPSELRPLVKHAQLEREPGDGPAIYRGSVGHADILASKTGIGTKAAAAAAERMLKLGDIDLMLVVGIAGGVGTTLGIADVLVPETVYDGPSGTAYTPAPLPVTSGVRTSGSLETSDEFLVDADRLDRLEARGVIAVDMETSAIAEVCERQGCAWAAVRSISDRAGETPLDVVGLANPDGSPNVSASLKYLAAHPTRVPGLMKLARDATRAANAAAAAAVRVCSALSPG